MADIAAALGPWNTDKEVHDSIKTAALIYCVVQEKIHTTPWKVIGNS